MDERFEELKRELFMSGTDAIEDFLGCNVADDADKDTLDNMMDETGMQMTDDILETYYNKYL